MATFQIHQDSEKENSIQSHQENRKMVPTKVNKRPTFAVLNNVTHGARGPQGKTVFRDVKSVEINDENFGHVRNQTKKITTNVPVEQFKTFSVYEDTSESVSVVEFHENQHDDSFSSNANTSGAIRNPLKEISFRNPVLETPMSVNEIISPMSIDKSSHIDDENKKLITLQSQPPRNDRERFFEVEEYQHHILEYFREVEKKHRPKIGYMQRQPDINYSMRTILVDWLVEVAEEYRLQSETLCLAVSYIDRFLSYMSVVRAKLQLVGTAAMFIASKYEEIYPPDVGEFVFITDDTYTKTQVLRMEQIILKVLYFDLNVPTTLTFINTYCVLYEIPDQVKYLALYLSELSLLEAEPYIQYLPSEISSASLALARHLLDYPIWCPELEEITTYSLENLKEIIVHLNRTHHLSFTLSQQAIQEKYKASKYMQVSTIKTIELNEEQLTDIIHNYNTVILLANNDVITNDEYSTAATNENVRKMISSLMFV